MTHLSVKTLRHYHQVGLLEPAQVNPDTGYRLLHHRADPHRAGHRRLRDLEMPVATGPSGDLFASELFQQGRHATRNPGFRSRLGVTAGV